MNDKYRLLDQIIEGHFITPVFQPIASLKDGKTYGYEALSRISNPSLSMNIEEMFQIADECNKSWALETLCRTKALEHLEYLGMDKKLFLNVNANIIYDKKFQEGFTKQKLKEDGIDSDNIIFEITERVAVTDGEAFLGSINHYKNQKYGIAIDDVGSCYSGLNIIASVKPNLIKLSTELVRDIDKSETKQLLCQAMVDFSKSAGTLLIAEGIETEEELKALIRLRVDLGQGFFLGFPEKTFKELSPDKIELIKKHHGRSHNLFNQNSIYPMIGLLSKPGYTFSPEERAEVIYETIHLSPSITEFTIVENETAIGFMTKNALSEAFGGRYGFSLNSKKRISQLTMADFLRVDYYMPADHVSSLAMRRTFEQLYSPIVVEKEGNYWGIVTIKDLLEACTKAEVDTAMHSNPLTRLPGNLIIEKEILSRVFEEEPYCITYYDIDNFKAYNDVYGFKNGDMMLALVADTLKNCAINQEFIGHIGGDDFIVIFDTHDAKEYCQNVIDQFSSKVTLLYHEEDITKGYITSKNRHGVTENFPIASLSIAGISNKNIHYETIDSFSKEIAHLKKKCKRQSGNYFEII